MTIIMFLIRHERNRSRSSGLGTDVGVTWGGKGKRARSGQGGNHGEEQWARGLRVRAFSVLSFWN